MEISDKMVAEFKEIYRKTCHKDMDDAEARESARNLLGFVSLLLELRAKDLKRKARLKKEPGGFPVDGQYSCLLCGDSIDPTTGWYDWYGQTCLLCRKAVQNGAIPTFVFQHRNSYFVMWQLKDKFGIHPAAVRKYIKDGSLKAREVLNDNGTVHEYVFLKKENPGLIERYSPERKSYDRHRKKIALKSNQPKQYINPH